MNTDTSAQRSTHAELGTYFPHFTVKEGETELTEFVLSDKHERKCWLPKPDRTFDFNSILFPKSETQCRTFFLSCDSHPHVLLFGDREIPAQKAQP